ncbi:MAG: alpha-hydroxy acid oxidase [Acidobacteria bacterium]|nr:alpha-hydroxy acid oxidase [Acidobacteriota bacterium]
MTGRRPQAGVPDPGASRREFFRLLAASPLLGLAASGLPATWQRALAHEAERRATPGAGLPHCPECGTEMPSALVQPRFSAGQDPVLPPQNAIEEQLTGQTIESPDEAINVWDFERVAHANNLAQHWDYLHMGVDDYETRKANREGFQRLMLRPRRLGGEPLGEFDTSVELYGRRWESPLFLCPVASLAAYHTQGEAGAARGARPRGVLQMQSHQSSQSYAEIAEARGEPHWFQIYTVPDWNVNKRVIDRVASAGCPALVWTIDLLGGSNRELQRRTLAGEGYSSVLCQTCHQHHPDYRRPMRAGLEGPEGPRYPYTWDYVKRLKDASDMKVILKGIMTAEGAEQAIEHGADGIFVSNHGGRAVNSMWSSIDSLPEVVGAVRGRVPVFIDSGVRRGTDIFKALALGADAVGIGRPYVWGLGAFGEDGVAKVIDLILAEFQLAMRQTRTTSTDQITSRFVMEGKSPIMMRDNRLGFGL